MASPGDRPDLPLEEEPLPFLHPRDAGTSAPVHAVGAREELLLEEEPAEWIAFDADPRPPLRAPDRRAPRRGAPDAGGDGPLPSTGPSAPAGLAAAGIAAAWLLRRRGRGRSDGA